jgi:hypothetical protein
MGEDAAAAFGVAGSPEAERAQLAARFFDGGGATTNMRGNRLAGRETRALRRGDEVQHGVGDSGVHSRQLTTDTEVVNVAGKPDACDIPVVCWGADI